MDFPMLSESGALQRTLAIFFRTKKKALAVYLFGSQASGRAGPRSDIDVAVLLDRKSASKAFDLEMQWREALSRIFERDVDVVILNRADPVLKFQVYAKGAPVLIRNRREASMEKERAIDGYWDWRPTERILNGSAK